MRSDNGYSSPLTITNPKIAVEHSAETYYILSYHRVYSLLIKAIIAGERDVISYGRANILGTVIFQ
jgi:hypothetical protein